VSTGVQGGQWLCAITLSVLCRSMSPVVSRRLHSAAWGDLVIDTSISDFRQHSVSVTALEASNELPYSAEYSDSRLFKFEVGP